MYSEKTGSWNYDTTLADLLLIVCFEHFIKTRIKQYDD